MSMLIKGMEMPKGSDVLTIAITSAGEVLSIGFDNTIDGGIFLSYPNNYPIEAVPVPAHGRLIDADALIKVFKTKAKNPLNQETTPYSWAFAYECLADAVGDMPTIIPAEEGE